VIPGGDPISGAIDRCIRSHVWVVSSMHVIVSTLEPIGAISAQAFPGNKSRAPVEKEIGANPRINYADEKKPIIDGHVFFPGSLERQRLRSRRLKFSTPVSEWKDNARQCSSPLSDDRARYGGIHGNQDQ
jgi:hypothetical protein